LAFGGMPNGMSAYDDLFNKSYATLKGRISGQAMWLVNLAEYNQSLRMMTERLVQIARFTNRLRKLDFVGAARVLGLDGKPAKVSYMRSMANNWLEYSFGWKPLIEDIYSTIDLLQNPIKSIRPKGASSDTYYFDSNPNFGGAIWSRKRQLGLKVTQQGCEVTISNPNLYLANNLGLVNPATLAWELIPFSFVVDWFANVGDFLASGTDFLGLTVTKPWRTAHCRASVTMESHNIYDDPVDNRSQFNAHYTERALSLSGVTLSLRPARFWGWQRAANAAAVLTQALGRK